MENLDKIGNLDRMENFDEFEIHDKIENLDKFENLNYIGNLDKIEILGKIETGLQYGWLILEIEVRLGLILKDLHWMKKLTFRALRLRELKILLLSLPKSHL